MRCGGGEPTPGANGPTKAGREQHQMPPPNAKAHHATAPAAVAGPRTRGAFRKTYPREHPSFTCTKHIPSTSRAVIWTTCATHAPTHASTHSPAAYTAPARPSLCEVSRLEGLQLSFAIILPQYYLLRSWDLATKRCDTLAGCTTPTEKTAPVPQPRLLKRPRPGEQQRDCRESVRTRVKRCRIPTGTPTM